MDRTASEPRREERSRGRARARNATRSPSSQPAGAAHDRNRATERNGRSRVPSSQPVLAVQRKNCAAPCAPPRDGSGSRQAAGGRPVGPGRRAAVGGGLGGCGSWSREEEATRDSLFEGKRARTNPHPVTQLLSAGMASASRSCRALRSPSSGDMMCDMMTFHPIPRHDVALHYCIA